MLLRSTANQETISALQGHCESKVYITEMLFVCLASASTSGSGKLIFVFLWNNRQETVAQTVVHQSGICQWGWATPTQDLH